MQARLVVDASGYRLERLDTAGWVALARLAEGGRALLPGTRPVDQAALEAAIERAEDWLMPHMAALQGADLEVIDTSGQLDAGLREVFPMETRQWTGAQLEALFLELDFMTARPHKADRLERYREVVPGIVLLRELAHHGKLGCIRMLSKT